MDAITSSPTAAVGSATQNTASSTSAVSSDFETFLRMLTVQVQNQDPLNPVDATDYATQLATFSSVEQQVLTNDLLKDLTGVMSGNQLQNASEWLGMEALAEAPVFFNTSPISVRPDFTPGADSAVLIVKDQEGNEVQRFPLDPDEDENVFWAGLDDNSELLPAGVYQFDVESSKDGEVIGTRAAQVYNPIVEVRTIGNSVIFGLSDGSDITADEIAGLRPPQG